MNESIGAKLKQAREQRRLTLQQVSETTKVRTHYLQALENDDLSAISSAAQARGFLRIYADFLGLNAAELMMVKNPAETSPAPHSAISSLNRPLASEQEAISSDKPERSGLLGNLLNRFSHRKEKETGPLQTPEMTPSAEIPAAPELKPFVPARVTEELPAAPDTPAEEPAPEIKAIRAEPTPAIDTTPTVKAVKKTGSRPRKTTARVDKQPEVKKKINE
jgi:cytoskeleton protein RodZ